MLNRDMIGNTPIIKLKKTSYDMADIYVKLEYYNLGGSIKSRVAKQMIEDARRDGSLDKGTTLIEATGGNTGIGMSIMSNIYGYKFIAVVPDNYSKSRINILKMYGAEVNLSDHKIGNNSHILKKNELLLKNKEYICLDQFANESSIKAHYIGTGREIASEISNIVAFVSGVGSAGTFMGISKYLKEQSSNKVLCYIVQPEGCDIKKGKSVPHPIQGISLGIKPVLLDMNFADGIIDVNTYEILKMFRKLCIIDGLFLGVSSVANIVAAAKIAKKIKKGKVVTVAADSGNYYLDFYKQALNEL